MLDKLKEIERMDITEIIELYQAILAYNLGLDSENITLEEIDKIQETIEYYYDNESIDTYINADIIDEYNRQ